MVPLMHLENAGFSVDICTPTGKPAKLETWAVPAEDKTFLRYFEEKVDAFEKPLSLNRIATKMDSLNYLAVFVPGGHGAMAGLPDNEDVAKLIAWVKENDKFMLTICHGPAALLAGADKYSIYKGYEIVAFPDSIDKSHPYLGYTPGGLPWYVGEKLTEAGLKVINKTPIGHVHKDRKLITGDGPKAANEFGRLITESLLEATQ